MNSYKNKNSNNNNFYNKRFSFQLNLFANENGSLIAAVSLRLSHWAPIIVSQPPERRPTATPTLVPKK